MAFGHLVIHLLLQSSPVISRKGHAWRSRLPFLYVFQALLENERSESKTNGRAGLAADWLTCGLCSRNKQCQRNPTRFLRKDSDWISPLLPYSRDGNQTAQQRATWRVNGVAMALAVGGASVAEYPGRRSLSPVSMGRPCVAADRRQPCGPPVAPLKCKSTCLHFIVISFLIFRALGFSLYPLQPCCIFHSAIRRQYHSAREQLIKTPQVFALESICGSLQFVSTLCWSDLSLSLDMTRAVDEKISVSIPNKFSRFLTDLNGSPYSAIDAGVTAQWWKVLEGATLMQTSACFHAYEKEKNVAARWARLRKKVTKLARGLSQDENARNLALQHWLEAVDATHRYGHNLQVYFSVWLTSGTKEAFFQWLDSGEGKDLDLLECPRSKLLKEQIMYLGPKERRKYEVVVKNGKLIFKHSKEPLNTPEGDKMIFVLSTNGKLYVGQKEKGKFQHSSFLAGGAATAAGRMCVKEGVLELVEAHSGHYRPTEENFRIFVDLLDRSGVDLTLAKIEAVSHEMSRARIKLQKSLSSESDQQP